MEWTTLRLTPAHSQFSQVPFVAMESKLGVVAHEIADPPVTIYEVAAAAGVSPSTVSRTFARPGRVSVRTADHVRAIATELGYREDSVVRPVRSVRHRTIGLAVSDITNPFYFGLLRGAEIQASKQDYTVLLMDAQESLSQERSNMDRVLPLIDGLIVASSRMSDTVLRSIAKGQPIVVVNRVVAGLPSVVPDTAQGMTMAITHLTQLGHSSIHYLAGPDTSWISGMRWLALRSAAQAAGVTAHRLGPVPATLDGGASAAPQIMARRASAVICFSDLIAIGLIRALMGKGQTIPGDISVIGCDNIFYSDLIYPSLSTIAAPMGLLGDTAVRHIVSALSGSRSGKLASAPIPVKLIVRDSTGPAPWRH